jgi:SAM-dependent methyltransferase
MTTRKLLHVGCGFKKKAQTTHGFNSSEWEEIRLDINPNVMPDFLGSMVDMSVIDTGSVDAIFSSHNIEHLYPFEVPKALGEFQRVLAKDGFLVLTCPDLQSVCKLIAEDQLTDTAYMSPAGPITPLDILYGFRPSLSKGDLYMAHRCGFTRKVLHATLKASGFESVVTYARPRSPFFDLWALATKNSMPQSNLKNLVAQHFPTLTAPGK